jgi:hypothetical protein
MLLHCPMDRERPLSRVENGLGAIIGGSLDPSDLGSVPAMLSASLASLLAALSSLLAPEDLAAEGSWIARDATRSRITVVLPEGDHP